AIAIAIAAGGEDEVVGGVGCAGMVELLAGEIDLDGVEVAADIDGDDAGGWGERLGEDAGEGDVEAGFGAEGLPDDQEVAVGIDGHAAGEVVSAEAEIVDGDAGVAEGCVERAGGGEAHADEVEVAAAAEGVAGQEGAILGVDRDAEGEF